MENNKITLIGEIIKNFEYAYSIYGENFYSATILVKRESGNCDTLPLICSDRMTDVEMDFLNKKVQVLGSIRTYNEKDKTKSHLKIYVFVDELYYYDNDNSVNDEDIANITGYICKKQPMRTTPLGRVITDITLAVNAPYHKSHYIPCVFWGRNAKYIDKLNIGSEVNISGRLQSRIYKKENEEKVAYEFSVQSVDLL